MDIDSATGMLMLLTAALAILAPSAWGLDRAEFPPGFLFGAATSAYQIKGAYLEDGKGINNWMSSPTHGEDVEIMHDLGVNSYRFSISWARILPSMPRTMHIHITPLFKEEFDYYADVCFRAFGDRVKFWTTFNEPNVFAKHSYMLGTYPPNHCSAPFGTCNSGNSNREPYVAAHNIIMSHAAAVDNYKRNYQTAIVGFYDVPEGMEQIIEYVNKRYENTPVYVTENGYSQHSSNGLEDLINDVGRVNYLQGYLSSISSAVRRGANVRGYFVWSLMDNFEWAYGFTVRFGLYHVDFDTQVRTQKMSAKWYQGFLMGSRPVDALQTLRAGS
ncbi:hypothetical protein ACQ4PT_049954 [Festuca glaucescens]